MADEHLESMMENLYWWGIPTMFRCLLSWDSLAFFASSLNLISRKASRFSGLES